MKSPIFECVANFSEGRRPEVAQAIAAAAAQHVPVLDLHTDPDHNRSVLSIAGPRTPLLNAVLDATATAISSIDLRRHDGVHPRIGAMDVVPFVPLVDTTLADAAELARECAQRTAEDNEIPCFLYGEASPQRFELPTVRRDAFKTLTPDFGPPNPHPTAGATAIGARSLLVAYNINLSAPIESAVQIARSIRESDGGLPFVRALALRLPSRGICQVSTNLIRPSETRITDVYDAVSRMATDLGIELLEAELVGLAPKDAFGGRDPESVGLNSSPKILETELARIFEI